MDGGEDSGRFGHLWDVIVEHVQLSQQGRDTPLASKYISFTAEKTHKTIKTNVLLDVKSKLRWTRFLSKNRGLLV